MAVRQRSFKSKSLPTAECHGRSVKTRRKPGCRGGRIAQDNFDYGRRAFRLQTVIQTRRKARFKQDSLHIGQVRIHRVKPIEPVAALEVIWTEGDILPVNLVRWSCELGP